MRHTNPTAELERLRKYRNRKGPDLSLSREVEAVRKQVTRRANASGGLDGEWDSLLPDSLAGFTRILKLDAGGVLTVKADDSAAAYELDQWLRSGGLATLRGACTVTLRRVKITLG